jgi:hypothetical protein
MSNCSGSTSKNFQDAASAVALNWALNLTILGAAILLAILGAVATLIERTRLKQYRWAAGLLILCWLATMFAFWFNKPFAFVFDLYAILFDLLGPLESKALELAYEMSAVWRLLSRVTGIGLIAFVHLDDNDCCCHRCSSQGREFLDEDEGNCVRHCLFSPANLRKHLAHDSAMPKPDNSPSALRLLNDGYSQQLTVRHSLLAIRYSPLASCQSLPFSARQEPRPPISPKSHQLDNLPVTIMCCQVRQMVAH